MWPAEGFADCSVLVVVSQRFTGAEFIAVRTGAEFIAVRPQSSHKKSPPQNTLKINLHKKKAPNAENAAALSSSDAASSAAKFAMHEYKIRCIFVCEMQMRSLNSSHVIFVVSSLCCPNSSKQILDRLIGYCARKSDQALDRKSSARVLLSEKREGVFG
jgi:hypothetical protein